MSERADFRERRATAKSRTEPHRQGASRRRIGETIAGGAVWMILLKLFVRSIGLISILILARLLTPEDFGLVAIAATFVTVIELLSEFGFERVLIRDQNATKVHYNTVWTLTIVRAVLSAVLLAILGSQIAEFFDDTRLTVVVYVLSIGVVIEGLNNVGIINFRKDMEFGREFQFRLIIRLVTFVVNVVLAVWLRNYWALIGGIIIGKVAGLVLSYSMHSYRPRLSVGSCLEIMNYSKWILANNLLSILRVRLDTFLMGRFVGADGVGFFMVAREIAALPTTELIWPIMRVAFPGYSKISSNLPLLRETYLGLFAILTFFSLPAAVGIVAASDLIVAVALGEQWLAVVPLLQVLAVGGAFRVLFATVPSIFFALNKPHIPFWINAATAVLFVPGSIYGVMNFGGLGVAVAIAVVSAVDMVVNKLVLVRTIEMQTRRLLFATWRTVASCLFMYIVVFAAREVLNNSLQIDAPASALAVTIVVGIVSYALAHVALWRIAGLPDGVEAQILRMAKSKIAGRWR